MNEMVERILELKKVKDVVILAHYYAVSYTHLDVYKRQDHCGGKQCDFAL